MRRHPPPRARRLGHLRRGRRGAGHAPAQHHRSRGRPSADGQRGRQRAGRPQRRDLQPRGAPPGARGPRPPVPHAERHRGARPPVRGRGRADAPAAPGHVRPRDLGPSPSAAAARPRPLRAEAAVLHRAGRPPHLRLGDQGAAGPRPRAGHALAVRARPVPDAALRATARHVLRADPGAAAGPLHGLGDGRAAAHRALLGPDLRAQVELLRGGDAGADRRAPGRVRAAAPDERRAGRGLPERRAGLDPDRGPRGQGARARAPDVLDGDPVPRSERAPGRGRGGAAVRDAGTSPRK